VNYFRDFTPALSSYLYPLTERKFGENGRYGYVTHHQSAHERLRSTNIIYGCLNKSSRRRFDCKCKAEERSHAFSSPTRCPSNIVADGLTRIFHLDLKTVSPSVRYCFKDDSTQRIFRMDVLELEFQKSMSSDSEDKELEVNKAQDKDSEVKFQKTSAIFEKFHNSVVGHLGCDRTYKALKLSHNWVGMKDRLKKIHWRMYYFPEDKVEAVGKLGRYR